MPVLCDEIRRLVDSLDESEILRARNQHKAATLMSLESTGARAEQIGEQVLIYGRPIPVSEIVQRIEAVDAMAVARVARRIFSGRPSLAAIGPLRRMMAYRAIASRIRRWCQAAGRGLGGLARAKSKGDAEIRIALDQGCSGRAAFSSRRRISLCRRTTWSCR